MEIFDETFRFKAPRKLKARLARIAKVRTKKISELGREAFLEFAQKEELRLGITGKTSS